MPDRWLGRAGIVAAGLLGLAAGGLAGAPAAHADATVLYVGGAGCSDQGPGTADQPYCTISAAAAAVLAGQSVVVAAGTYAETVTVGHSGQAGSPITLRPADGATVTVTGGTNGFAVNARQYVTISGFRVTGTTAAGISVTGSSNIVLSGNTVSYAGQPMSGKVAPGIYLSGTTASRVTANTANHNSDSGIFLAMGTTGTTVDHNVSTFNARGYQRAANGINVVGANNSIIGNVLHDNEDSGMQFYPGGDNGLAALNVTYNNGDHGIDNLNVAGGRLIGNTVYHNCTSGINVEGTSGNYLVENNIAVDNAVYPAYNGISCNRRAGNIGIYDSATASTTVNANLVWLSTAGTMYAFGSSYTSLAAMRAATGQEQQGLQADPAFDADLRLTAGSPAIDSADSAASGEQPVDLTGAGRVDEPSVANTGTGPRAYDDRGAYEFGATGGSPSPPVAALNVTPSTGPAPLAVTADASASTDPQGSPLTYAFSFGDGTGTPASSQATAAHTYSAPGAYTVTVTVTNSAGLSSTASASVTVNQPSGGGSGPAAYVSQIATNYATATRTAGSITVWRSQGVQAGHLVVLTLTLTGTAATGAVSGTDDAGNTFTLARDVADGAGNRLVVLYGIASNGLVPTNKIYVTFPSAATYRLIGDEASGVVVPDRTAAATGTGSPYASGPTGTTASPTELVFGAVVLTGGSAPAWASGWTATSSYAVGSTYTGRAYQLPAATGSFNASGTGPGNWLAVCVTFD